MVTFTDGPAAGSHLSLARAPLLLRVVINSKGKVDALDQLTDTPEADESIHVYRRVGDAGEAIICSRGKGCKHVMVARYKVNGNQPDDAVARDNAQWQRWAEENAK